MMNCKNSRIICSIIRTLSLSCLLLFIPSTHSFHHPSNQQSFGSTDTSSLRRPQQQQQTQRHPNAIDRFQTSYRVRYDHPQQPSSSSTSLNNFGGEGFLGIGTPELATILVVGYFLLGPSDLYKLVKEIGKFINQIQTLGTDAAKTFESSMENQIEMTELRNAQQELTDAFSFRRSINTDESYESTIRQTTRKPTSTEPAPTTTSASEEEEGAAAPSKRKRRRVKKIKKAPSPVVEESEINTAAPMITQQQKEEKIVEGNVPDLSMADAFFENNKEETPITWEGERDDAKVAQAASAAEEQSVPYNDDWFNDLDPPSWPDLSPEELAVSQEDLSEYNLDTTTADNNSGKMTYQQIEEQQRSHMQMSNSWNDKIADNKGNLGKLSFIIGELALLEEQKIAANERLEEEFRVREEVEEKYYQEKRETLESSPAVEVPSDASNKTEMSTTATATTKIETAEKTTTTKGA